LLGINGIYLKMKSNETPQYRITDEPYVSDEIEDLIEKYTKNQRAARRVINRQVDLYLESQDNE